MSKFINELVEVGILNDEKLFELCMAIVLAEPEEREGLAGDIIVRYSLNDLGHSIVSMDAEEVEMALMHAEDLEHQVMCKKGVEQGLLNVEFDEKGVSYSLTEEGAMHYGAPTPDGMIISNFLPYEFMGNCKCCHTQHAREYSDEPVKMERDIFFRKQYYIEDECRYCERPIKLWQRNCKNYLKTLTYKKSS